MTTASVVVKGALVQNSGLLDGGAVTCAVHGNVCRKTGGTDTGGVLRTGIGVVVAGNRRALCAAQGVKDLPTSKQASRVNDFVGLTVKKMSEKRLDRKAPIYFLCRSGVRGLAAAIAMTQAGDVNCFNIAGGFEDL